MNYEHLSPELREIAIKRQMEFENSQNIFKNQIAQDISDWNDKEKIKQITLKHNEAMRKKAETERLKQTAQNNLEFQNSALELLNKSQTPINAMYERTKWCNLWSDVYTDKLGRLCGEQMLNEAGFQIFAGNSSVGKSMLISEIVLRLLVLREVEVVYYFNFDASAQTFAHRGQADLIASFQRQGRFIPIRQNELEQNGVDVALTLKSLVERGEELCGVVFVIDVLSYMVSDINKGAMVNEFLSKLRALCNQGAMCIVIAHNNKLGEIFAGSAEIKNKPDNLVQISIDESVEIVPNVIHLKLERTKGKEAFFHYHKFLKLSIDLNKPSGNRLIFRGFDNEQAKITPLQNELKNEILAVLKENEKITQGELLTKIGRSISDATALKVLREHNTLEGEFLWYCNKSKRDDGKWIVEYSLKPFTRQVIDLTNISKKAR